MRRAAFGEAMPAPCYMSALVLSEDGSSSAFDTVRMFVKHILLAVDPRTQTHVIDFEPPSDPAAREALSGNRWREGRGPAYVRLLSAIAAKLAEPGGFVFFHFDGDTTWTERQACLTGRQFDELIVRRIPDLICARLASTNERPKRKAFREASCEEIDSLVARAMPRLFSVVPHYSVEAWCYQNTGLARELCARSSRGRPSCTQCAQWELDRTLLDEIEKVKEECRLRSDHNADLAGKEYPWPAVLAADKSFAFTVRQCQREPLISTLAMTYAYPRPPSVC